VHRVCAQCLRAWRRRTPASSIPATPHRIIYKLRELTGVEEMGGTMRLGAWTCVLEPDSLAAKAYGTTEISERHRHRYEFNREYERHADRRRSALTGTTPDATYVEIVEIPEPHPFFLGCQFHPEFKSKPLEPHPGSTQAMRPLASVRRV
jgi:CTP synthase